ncbi:MAG: hypothetical protein R3D66_03285 [Alphaproteobacteria bacterium]
MLAGFFQRFIAPVASTLGLNLDQNFLEELISGWLSENPVVAKMLGIEPAQQAKASVDPTGTDNTQETAEASQGTAGPVNEVENGALRQLTTVYNALNPDDVADETLKTELMQARTAISTLAEKIQSGELNLKDTFTQEVNATGHGAVNDISTLAKAVQDSFNAGASPKAIVEIAALAPIARTM